MASWDDGCPQGWVKDIEHWPSEACPISSKLYRDSRMFFYSTMFVAMCSSGLLVRRCWYAIDSTGVLRRRTALLGAICLAAGLVSGVCGELVQGHAWWTSFNGKFIFQTSTLGAYVSLTRNIFGIIEGTVFGVIEGTKESKGKLTDSRETLARLMWLTWCSSAAGHYCSFMCDTEYHNEGATAKGVFLGLAWGVCVPGGLLVAIYMT
jgi:hypothetical protein